MFKNFIAYRIGANWAAPSLQDLEQTMQRLRFTPCESMQEESVGWSAPRGKEHDPMMESISGQWIAKLMIERKSVPASAVKNELEKRCKEIEEQRGTAPGRRERKQMKEDIYFEMLPRAFAKRSAVTLWIDTANRMLVVGTSSLSAADLVVAQVIELMKSANHDIAISALRTKMSPTSSMSSWLTTFEAPAGFTVDRELELKLPDEQQSTVRYARHALDIEEVAAHIHAGKVPTMLAMTWDSRVSFILTENFTVKKIELLDDIFVQSEEAAGFDGDVALLTGELSKLIPDLVLALGGEAEPDAEGDDTDAGAADVE